MLNLAVDDETAIIEGEQAADRLVRGQTLDDQLKVARALTVGRRVAMNETGSNAPAGKPYIVAFNRWLAKHPRLAAINHTVRAAALWCIDPDNWPKVEAALAKLDDQTRMRATLRGLRAQIEREGAPAIKSSPSPRMANSFDDAAVAQEIVSAGARALLARDAALAADGARGARTRSTSPSRSGKHGTSALGRMRTAKPLTCG
jgi:hypothetical protein